MIPNTYFCDIDGCILEQTENFFMGMTAPKFLPGTREKLLEWHVKGAKIILTTGRPETQRENLEKLFKDNQVFYDKLIMDCGCGVRILINDIDPRRPQQEKALSVNLTRNKGIGVVYL
jgi:hypothetical protein